MTALELNNELDVPDEQSDIEHQIIHIKRFFIFSEEEKNCENYM